MVKNIVNNILKKITDKFSVKNEKFELTSNDENDKGQFNPLILISVFLIVSLILDILKFTPVYDNNIMKHILNTNYWLSYGITSLVKLSGFVMIAFMGLPEIFSDLKDNKVKLAEAETEYSTEKSDSTKKTYVNALSEYNDAKYSIYFFSSTIIILLISFIFDMIQFTPLIKNKYINQIVSLNSYSTTMLFMLIKQYMCPLPFENRF